MTAPAPQRAAPAASGEPISPGPTPGMASAEPGEATPRPSFAHASEAEFARILEFYQVRWEYEPHVFPILWSLDGAVLESFAPDFYLPELDLYVEMTTLRQKLVRKKNRKLRRLRELYPDIRIKLFYARDFRALMLKYGKLAIADALSGAEGQVNNSAARPAAPAAGDAIASEGVAVAHEASEGAQLEPPRERRRAGPGRTTRAEDADPHGLAAASASRATPPAPGGGPRSRPAGEASIR